MLNPIALLPVAVGQAVLPQTLNRTPEKASMDDQDSVNQYEGADQSKLAIVYAAVLDRIHRMRRVSEGGTAIDLCCGPGHFTLMLAKYFDFDEVIGVDLSEPMIEKARQRAKDAGLDSRVRFELGDATAIEHASDSFDVVSCNDAAHHMPDLQTVSRLFLEMDRLSSAQGICILSDLVRLKSEWITERYTKEIGKGYPQHFYNDFCNSMRAAWRPSEIAGVLPTSATKAWSSEHQKVIPTVQFAYGVPADNQPRFVNPALSWPEEQHPIPSELRTDWQMFNRLL
jgi:ubiquinone/menaquinone biosynthesis C-methylase UbiE